MVKKQKKNIRKNRTSKQFNIACEKARKVNASTEVDTCSEQLSPFGGIMGLANSGEFCGEIGEIGGKSGRFYFSK